MRSLVRFWLIWPIIALLALLSPTVVRSFVNWQQRLESQNYPTPLSQLLEEARPIATPDFQKMQTQWAASVTAYQRALLNNDIVGQRHVRLLEFFWQVYQQAWSVLGPYQTAIVAQLLTQEVVQGSEATYASPEASLTVAARWIQFIHNVDGLSTKDIKNTTPFRLGLALAVASPYPLEPRPVLQNAHWINLAMRQTYLLPEVLAAIIDNEQSGGALAYGLSSLVRGVADTLALQIAKENGYSGFIGHFSQTIGLTQMSWQDALAQKSRFHALGLQFGVPFPKNETEARILLGQPYANFLLAASRLRGYLNVATKRDPLDTTPYREAWIYLSGPAWHNRPDLASQNHTFSYAFHGFFKACLYAKLLPKLG